MNQYDCVYEKPSATGSSISVRDTPPPLNEQLSLLAETTLRLFESTNTLTEFLLGRRIDLEKRETDTVTGYLAWINSTLTELNRSVSNLTDGFVR